MNTKHPLPWRSALTLVENSPVTYNVYAKAANPRHFNGDVVAVCEDEDDAKAIALAVNSHDELVAALRECITENGARCMVDEGRNSASICRRRRGAINAMARAAIRKAEGK